MEMYKLTNTRKLLKIEITKNRKLLKMERTQNMNKYLT